MSHAPPPLPQPTLITRKKVNRDRERERENPMSCAHVVNETNETDMKMSRQSIGEEE